MRTVDLILISALLGALLPDASARASDDPAQNFVEEQHHRLEHLLHAPASSSRDAQVRQALGGFVDYDDLTRRAFGEPCPSSQPSCEDLWAGYDDGQHAELRGLMEQLVRKNYENNLTKTLDFDVTYRGTRDVGGDTRVLTEAKDRGKPREPAVRVDYVVKQTKNGLKVVDVITEGSSMAKAYYEQFRKKMHDPNEGYPNIVQKLRDKIAKTP
jgi:ABC-type transporter MlaC component